MSRADQLAWEIAFFLVVAAGGVLNWLVRDCWRDVVMRWGTHLDGGRCIERPGHGPVTVDLRLSTDRTTNPTDTPWIGQ